jgi:hypothetical protein
MLLLGFGMRTFRKEGVESKGSNPLPWFSRYRHIRQSPFCV